MSLLRYERPRLVSTSPVVDRPYTPLIKALLRDGFYLRAQAGSHQRYQHPDGRRVTVSFHHSSDTFPGKTLKDMIEDQARWSEDDLRRLRLIR